MESMQQVATRVAETDFPGIISGLKTAARKAKRPAIVAKISLGDSQMADSEATNCVISPLPSWTPPSSESKSLPVA
jgi:hypothetical protein